MRMARDVSRGKSDQPLLIIEFFADGHRSLYICLLVRYGLANHQTNIRFLLPSELRLSVLSQLSVQESLFFAPRVRVIEEEPVWLRIRKWIKDKRLARWLYVEHLNLVESRHARLLYLFLESVIYQVALCPLPRFCTSGVMFRPTFYYRKKGMVEARTSSRALFALKWLVGYLLAKRPGVEQIFLLDPLAANHARCCWKSRKFTLIPDPILRESSDVRPIGSADPISERPLRLLIAGALAPRKGLHTTADALWKCSEETKKSVTLLVVGKPEEGYTDYVIQNVARLRAMGIEVISDLRFVSDRELDELIAHSNIILTPYLDFKGSSGIVVLAAHFGKPVISTSEGLLGLLVRQHKLGEALDAGDTEQFSRCLERVVATGVVDGFDPTSARDFADSNDPQQFTLLLTCPLNTEEQPRPVSHPEPKPKMRAIGY
jgi:glycosyltransferase involved in cell wall biosynthesis